MNLLTDTVTKLFRNECLCPSTILNKVHRRSRDDIGKWDKIKESVLNDDVLHKI